MSEEKAVAVVPENAEKPAAKEEEKSSPSKPQQQQPIATGAVNVNAEKKRKQPSQPPAKQKKKKAKREEGAPKLPLTGYVRYMNKRRDELRTEFPDKTAIEHTKIIAEEWNKLSDELKKPFLQAAEIDKERYIRQIDEFKKQKSESQKQEALSSQAQPNSSSLGAKTSTSDGSSSNGTKVSPPNNDKPQMNGKDISQWGAAALEKQCGRSGEQGIPIFTDEFLEHNKTVDAELRMLRKSNIDYEQQNSVLEKHIENMKFGVDKVESENSELIEKNHFLQTYLDKLKSKLAQALNGLAIPNEPNGATIENIDKYMNELHSMTTSNSHGPASLNKAKDIIRKLDLQIQL